MSKSRDRGPLELILNALIVWPIKLMMFLAGMSVIFLIGLIAFAPLSSWGKDIKAWGSRVFARKA